MSWDEEDLAELYGLRAVLEGYAARLAAEHVTPEILRELEASNERYGELRDSEKLPELVAENSSSTTPSCAPRAAPA